MIVSALAGLSLHIASAGPAPIPLWPGPAPKDTGGLAQEVDTTDAQGGVVAGKRVIRLGNVSQPTLAFYPAPADKNSGATVVVCPGGGYHILALDLEGTEVAEWLNSIGVNAVLLKYRVPARAGRERWEAPVEDAQRALGLTRSHAQQWGIDSQRVGVMGFSAGAHLCAVLSSKWHSRTYPPVDAADELSCRPDFALLIYPAYLTASAANDKLAPELAIAKDTPPTFLVQTQDDGVHVECSVLYYLALKNAKVSAELHLYPDGGHGYGLRASDKTVTSWPKRAEDWLRTTGWLKPKA